MGNTDSIPVISQAKSGFQALAGDKQGARETQKNFLMGCPVVSQLGSLGAAVAGDTEYARKSHLYFMDNMSAMVDSIPVVGHVKGALHYASGKREQGDNAMKASSRTVGVIGGGIGGFLVGGPAGAVAGGVAGGAAMDCIITGAESAVKENYVPSGHLNFATRAAQGNLDAGGYFDWIMTPVFDGVAGRAYAKTFQSIRTQMLTSRNLKAAIKQAVEKGEITLQEGETINSLAKQLQSAAKKVHREAAASKAETPVVGTIMFDVEGNSYVAKFSGDVPPAEQVISGRAPALKRPLSGRLPGEMQCAEIKALVKHNEVMRLYKGPSKTVSVVYDPITKSTVAIARCEVCYWSGRYMNFGEVPTDAIHGTVILSEEASLRASLKLLAPCECEEEEEEEEDND